MRVLVTRPILQARRTATKLSELGHECFIAPLFEIHYFKNVVINSEGLVGVVATSGRAIEALAQHPALPHIKDMPFYCVGEQTAAIARDTGFSNILKIGLDVDDLSRQFNEMPISSSGKLLYAAGKQRKDRLELSLLDYGVDFEIAVLYESRQINKFSSDIAFQIESGQMDAVLVFSRRGGEALVAALQKTGSWESLFQISYFAISPNAAEPLFALGNVSAYSAKEPNESALLKLLDNVV